MALARPLFVGFSSASKAAREGGNLEVTADGPRTFTLPWFFVRQVDALLERWRREEHEVLLLFGRRGVVTRADLWLREDASMPLPVLQYWPRPAEGAATVSQERHNELVDLALRRGRETLGDAAEAGGLRDTLFLLAIRVEVDFEHTTTTRTALERAAANGHLAVVTALLDAGATQLGKALVAASAGGHTPVAALLLARGADIEYEGDRVSALWAAATNGHVEVLRFLLDSGADDLDAALYEAVGSGQFITATLLLDRGADISYWDGACLGCAASAGDVAMVIFLLQRGADIDAEGEYGSSLDQAAAKGHLDVATALLDGGAAGISSALVYAAAAGRMAMVTLLLGRGADVNFVPGEEADGPETALQLAAKNDHLEVVLVLLDAGATSLGAALADAASAGKIRIVQLLLERGAEINASFLVQAASKGHLAIVQLLLERGADVNALLPPTWWSASECIDALEAAVYDNRLDVATALLDAGASRLNRALLCASKRGWAWDHLAVSRLLLDRGADASWELDWHSALSNRPVEMVQLLLERGTSLDGLLERAATLGHLALATALLDAGAGRASHALVLAAKHGHLAMVTLLLGRGAEVDFELDGETALLNSVENGHKAVNQALLDAGAGSASFRAFLISFMNPGLRPECATAAQRSDSSEADTA